MKIIGIMRTKNNEDIIGNTLKNFEPLVDHIIIHDDNSVDKTVEICKKFKKVKFIIINSKNYYDAAEDKNILIHLARFLDGDWILNMDSDEVFEDRIVKLGKLFFENLIWRSKHKIALFHFPLYHFWKSNTHYRIDSMWSPYTLNNYRPKLFQLQPQIQFKREECTGNFPTKIIGAYSFIADVRVKHYGYRNEEQIKQKYEIYKQTGLKKLKYINRMLDESNLRLMKWYEDYNLEKEHRKEVMDFIIKEKIKWNKKYGFMR